MTQLFVYITGAMNVIWRRKEGRSHVTYVCSKPLAYCHMINRVPRCP